MGFKHRTFFGLWFSRGRLKMQKQIFEEFRKLEESVSLCSLSSTNEGISYGDEGDLQEVGAG